MLANGNGHPMAGVFDRQAKIALGALGAEDDRRPVVRVLDGVEYQIVHRAPDLCLVEYGVARQSALTIHRDSASPRLLAKKRGMLGQEAADISYRLTFDIGSLHRPEQILQQLIHAPY